jgi:hypothetical protein
MRERAGSGDLRQEKFRALQKITRNGWRESRNSKKVSSTGCHMVPGRTYRKSSIGMDINALAFHVPKSKECKIMTI